ncbi:MAG: type I DNA topoisomerase [Patescibacteria group bacterium]|jgi:DNA topoisomerase-1
MSESKKLVVVESPTKARTISHILGNRYVVEASMGHLRDLPKAKLGVDVEHDFSPDYIIPTASRKVVTKLKNLYEQYPDLILATDEDREGEAIGWHITQALGIDPVKVPRIAFHEITREAVKEALEHPRQLDFNLVDAQQARRILDRLVGYKLSPLLWKKIFRGLSAGRVQSVTVRLIVDREREIQKFTPEEYWKIKVVYQAKQGKFTAELATIGDQPAVVNNQITADQVVADLKANPSQITKLVTADRLRYPGEPLTTSTLQQQAGTRFGFSVKKTMLLAQQLYEGVALGEGGHAGLITYMRTDSVNISSRVIDDIRSWVDQQFGPQYVPTKAYTYKSKSKTAQEAHEAIRPSVPSRTPDSLSPFLSPDQAKLYRLIWERTMASQMAPAILSQTDVIVTSTDKTLTAQGVQIKFPGFFTVLTKSPVSEITLPALTQNEPVQAQEVMSEQKFTEPPERYTEPALVKTLEKLGIGRPSTYAPTLTTIATRGYVKKEKRYLIPQETGFLVNDFLAQHFPDIVDVHFTARMEDDLDEIADGKRKWQDVIREFYQTFAKILTEKEKTLSRQNEGEKTDEVCEKCGGAMVIKRGRFGKFMACTNFPKCKNTKPLDEKSGAPEPVEVTDVKCAKCGNPMVKRKSRYGDFLGCSGYPKCDYIQNLNPNNGEVGGSCPKCSSGKVVERRTKRGKVFYGCSVYPKCDFASWDRPVPEKCPTCGGWMAASKTKKAPVCQSCGFVDKEIKA